MPVRATPPPIRRRGATMLMVLATLGAGTIVATAFLSSRDNSGLVGENVTQASSGRSLAMSGLEIGIAILQTKEDWRNDHVDGKLLDDHALVGGTFDLDLVDLETGDPPTNDTSEVRITCTAVVDGMEQRAIAEATVVGDPGSDDAPVPVHLPEFAVFAKETMELKDDSTIARWSTSPLAGAGKRVALGTQATAAGSVQLLGNAAAIDTTLYHGPGASSSLLSNLSGPPMQKHALADKVPMPKAPPAPVAAPGGTAYPSMDLETPLVVTSDLRKSSIVVKAPIGAMTVEGDLEIVAEDDLTLEPGTGLLIDGDVTIVVFDDLVMQTDSYIELKPGASLELHVGNTLLMADAYMGEVRIDKTDRDSSGLEQYMDPDRLRVVSQDLDATWKLEKSSVLKGTMYIPRSECELLDDSALYGRVACRNLRMFGNAALFYDHTLDPGVGYTNAESPLFTADGSIKNEVKALTTLLDSDLVSLADTLDLAIESINATYGSNAEAAPTTPITEPTPRPVDVTFRIIRTAGDVEAWEARAVAAANGGGGP